MSKVSTVVWHRLVPIASFLVIAAALATARTPDVQKRISGVESLSDTGRVAFGAYLAQTIKTVRQNWFKSIPERVDSPVRMSGEVVLEFTIKKDGHVAGIKLAQPSGTVMLDRAAWAGISASNPLSPLPPEFKGDHLTLRISFCYNRPPDGSTK
jgi:TonB family protein